MKKLIIEFDVAPPMRDILQHFLERIEHLEVIEVLRLDFKRGTKLVLADVQMKPGLPIDSLKIPQMVLLNVLNRDGDRYTCLMKAEVPATLKKLMKEFDLDLIWTAPMTLADEKVVFSVIGEEKELKVLLEKLALVGKAKVVSFQRASYDSHSLLSTLTDQQRKTVIEAKRRGYYEYPRKISAEGLAKKLGISKATVLEHLRKAEIRLLDNILAGY